MAHEMRIGSLNGTFVDAPLYQRVGCVHIPADLLGKHIGNVLCRAVALTPEDAHNPEFRIKKLDFHVISPHYRLLQ